MTDDRRYAKSIHRSTLEKTINSFKNFINESKTEK